MRFVIDMNLTPEWVECFKKEGYEAVHWVDIGNVSAKDSEIMDWARDNEYVVFTHDLDFGSLLASTNAQFPSVLQVRTQDTTPQAIKEIVFKALKDGEGWLGDGALITVDTRRSRIRVLPLRKS